MTIAKLDLYIRKNIIKPAISEQGIKEEAQNLGYGECLTIDQIDKLHNAIINNTVKKIDAFLHSPQAREMCEEASHMDGFRSYGCSLADNEIERRIRNLFQVTTIPSSQSASYMGSLLSHIWRQVWAGSQ